MSIVRIGLAETKKFAEGYDAIFKKKKSQTAAAKTPRAPRGSQVSQPKKACRRPFTARLLNSAGNWLRRRG